VKWEKEVNIEEKIKGWRMKMMKRMMNLLHV
jgi:hypothetical protein